MRVTKEKVAEHHAAIISAGAKLFREHGFDGVGVIEVMKEAGLTHGGFYGHFESKAALAAESCRYAFEQRHGVWPAGITLMGFVNLYLSAKHRDKPADGCPVACFSESIGRQAADVRREFAKGLETYLRQVAAQFEARGQTKAQARKNATLLITLLVGGITLARGIASTDRPFSDSILAETRRSVALQFGLQ